MDQVPKALRDKGLTVGLASPDIVSDLSATRFCQASACGSGGSPRSTSPKGKSAVGHTASRRRLELTSQHFLMSAKLSVACR